ncbi:MAG: hypothetical protein H6561_19400 [Lewinellaceae bacterium]|nr:hypothetical protein [Lewinellaceae bacterium]
MWIRCNCHSKLISSRIRLLGRDQQDLLLRNESLGKRSGIYQGAVKGANGCVTTFELDVIADQSLPNFTVKNDTLTCLKDSVQLTVLSTQPDITYFWAYADTIVFPDSNPWVKSPGKYFRIRNQGQRMLQEEKHNGDPGYGISSHKYHSGYRQLYGPYPAIDSIIQCLARVFTWSGPDNFSADSAWIDIHQEGLYKVTFTGRNGCPRSDEYQALLSSPSVTISGDSLLTCSNNSVLLTGISADAIRYQWTGPDGFLRRI